MRDYENLSKIFENREPQRAYYIPYESLEKALKGDKRLSSYYWLLNGKWRFNYYKNEDEIPVEITKWDKVEVPSNWQTTGYERPYYTNINYPFAVDAPYVPDDNPVGIYETDIKINKKWYERNTYIVFEGVSSCVYLYVNGEYVGYSQGSHLQAEFDITKFLKEGENVIRAKVMKWCSGSYLEDQDFFRTNGIFRDVYLLSREENCIKDIEIKADTKTISVFAEDYEIYDGKKKIKNFDNPILWNAEKPHLYTVVVKGKTEYIPIKIGMRDVKISKDGELLINGQSVILKGVNHHDTHPTKGSVMSEEDIRNDLIKMKELNINTIRTSHYPPTPEFLNMCDEMGFYVIDETDIECHGYGSFMGEKSIELQDYYCVSGKEEWTSSFIDRLERMIERDKNHASVIMWSMGNESNYLLNQKKMIEWAKKRDNSRIIHCEDACNRSFYRGGDSYLDVELYTGMYRSFAFIDDYCNDPGKTQPIFLCEYAHAMGNGPGDTWDYVKRMYKYKNFIGGCIWEWADHTAIEDGVQKYGGDFGENIHDGNFCCDGLVFSDRSFKAGSLNAKYAYQYYQTELTGNMLKVTNYYDFTNLNEYKLCVKITCDGRVLEEKEYVLDISPHEEMLIELPFKIPGSCYYGAFVETQLKKSKVEIVGITQHALDVPVISLPEKKKINYIKEENERFYVVGADFSYVINKRHGSFESIKKLGKEQLMAESSLTVWRAPTDNDRKIKHKWGLFEDNWAAVNMNRLFSKVYSCELCGNIIRIEGSLAGVSRAPFFRYASEYEFFADGTVSVRLKGDVDKWIDVYLPRLGYEFKLKDKNATFKYFGRGSAENYCDMNRHAPVGIYESNAKKEYVNYIMPQEHGNHSDCKMLEIKNGLKFKTKDKFEFNVSRYTSEELTNGTHTDEIKPFGGTNVRIDYKVSGIGSASCGPELDEAYRLSEKHIEFEFTIE